MASSSFYSGSSQDATNVNAVEDSKNAAALSEAAAAASAAASATSAASVSAFATTATTKASESAVSATASSTSAAASQASRVASEAAKVAAETAKTAAETARDAASVSEVASGAAEVAAETAEINAAASAAAALSSKNAAATSATTASTKATESASSATASEASNVAAGVAKVAAETAETNAETAQTASETAKTASEAAKVAAETAETNASTSAATATTQAGIATTKAGEAAASATASASSATASEAAKDAALAALDSFDDLYLGAKASDPTVDNDGDALVSGALYFNTTDDTMKVYEGSQWVAAYASLSGALIATNNLSDLTSASIGRANLGLGTAATTASTDYATAAQGALAASATQPGDLSPVATSGAYGDLSGTPTLGTAAATASTDYATAAQGALAASAVQPNDSAALKELDLNAIASTIADTAVDVFVYRTAADSDGGAWRKRTQGTSWYNETLNTATRGSRKEFPAVAVIVTEATKVTIYDGDDPDLPMWATQGSNLVLASIKAVTAKNGIVSVATTSGYLAAFNFVTSGPWLVYNTGGLDTYSGIIWSDAGSQISTDASKAIVNGNVNDVAMTVLPNAPIDSATGLPVPTIAVATAGGVSVIKDDGTVVDITFSSHGIVGNIQFVEEGKVLFTTDADTSQRFIKVYAIPSTDLSEGVGYDDNTALEAYQTRADGTGADLTFATPASAALDIANRNFATNKGLASVAPDIATPSRGLSSVTTSTYNTGWMNGDIKLATLSDTDDTDVTGSELVTNGDGSSTTGWAEANGGSASTSGGYLVLTANGTASPNLSQTFSTVVGQKYIATCTAKRGTATAPVGITIYGILSDITTSTTDVVVTVPFTASATSHTVAVFINGATANGHTAFFDNISVRLAEEDRSVNGNGLQVFGSVTKNPVRSGADLVAYSFADGANTNFLFQPYNSDLDFGTGDFSYTFWHSCGSSGSDRIWLSHGQYTTSGAGLGILQLNSGGGSGDEIYIYIGASGAGNINITGVEGLGFQQWVVTRRNGVVYAYRNGELEGSVANTTDIDLSSATIQGLYLGKGNNTTTEGNVFLYGAHKLALFRASATALSPEQIKKIYEDEKVLFQENAQATLYGSSDAVTALAYDDTTELLHVGTSAGRSSFQGLRRVDNTTDAVGAAISASNGLVAED